MTIRYRALRPITSHWRIATCAEVDCPNHLLGWKTILPATDLANMALIRRSGLSFKEIPGVDLTTFVFEAGQECFEGQAKRHRTRLERDPIFLRNRETMEPIQWIDNMNEHLNKFGGQNG